MAASLKAARGPGKQIPGLPSHTRDDGPNTGSPCPPVPGILAVVSRPDSSSNSDRSARSLLGRNWRPEAPPRTPAGRPFVYLNCALSADGKLAVSRDHFEPFGSRLDGALLYELRSHADAILCGARTLDSNPAILGNGGPRLTAARRERGLAPHPVRVVVSGRASIDPRAEIFKHRFSPIILLTSTSAPERNLRRLRTLVDEVAVFGDRKVDFHPALRWLRNRRSARSLLCEGGGELNAALLGAGLVDELFLTICPLIIGGRTAPTLADGAGVPLLDLAARFQVTHHRQIGDELFLRLRRARA